MKHAVFVGPGKVEWRETADPRIEGEQEALVRPLVVGRCDLDVAYLAGHLPMPAGAPIGHEIVGEVTDIGSAVTKIRPGDRVFVPAQISCGRCGACRRGFTGRCEAVPFAASYGMGREGGFGGGLADLVHVPFADAMLTPVPRGSNPAHLIGTADMGADAWRAVGDELLASPGSRVLVVGGMPRVIGLYAAAIAACMRAPVVYIDADPGRREIAAMSGADTYALLEDLPDNRYFDLIVVAAPDANSLSSAFKHAAPGALVTSVTPTLGGTVPIDTAPLYHRGLRWVIGRPDCRHAHNGAMHAWANYGFDPQCVPTEYVDWEDAPEAWSSDALYVAAVR